MRAETLLWRKKGSATRSWWKRSGPTGDLIVGTDSHTCTYGGLAAASTGIGTSRWHTYWQPVISGFLSPIRSDNAERQAAGSGIFEGYQSRPCRQIRFEFAQYRSIEFTGDLVKNLSIDSRLVLSNMSVEFGRSSGYFPWTASRMTT